jgi:hypothetical protein
MKIGFKADFHAPLTARLQSQEYIQAIKASSKARWSGRHRQPAGILAA